MTYTVFATIPVMEEHMDAACDAVASILAETRREDGCITFQPWRAADGSPNIMIYEEWVDHVSFEFHHKQDYTKDVFAKYEGWLRGAPDLVVAKPLKG